MGFIKSCTETCQDTFSNFKERVTPPAEAFGRHWKHLIFERALFQGLPVSVACTTLSAYIFAVASPLTGALFGATHYLTLFMMSEHFRKGHELDWRVFTVFTVISGAVTSAFLHNVCRLPLSYPGMAILTAAAVVGQFARGYFIEEYS